jgi:single-stranded-DNA-specific exonuclease
LNHRRWKVFPATEHLVKIDGLSPLATQLLHNRGVKGSAEVEAFLKGDESLQGDPFLLPDMERAVARIYQALLGGESMAIYGDFDADGICGVAVLTLGLSLLGGKVTPYIPHRINEGYGLNSDSLETLHRQGVTLVITVDCGISNFTEVERAVKRGLDVIITDHHVPPPVIPPALAVVNPKREDSFYPFSQLAGVGVAYKLIQGLFQTLGKEEPLEELLDLVALGTIADMVPLLGENRYLVKRGLETMSRTRRPGLQEMINLAGLSPGDLDTENVSWILVPRLNAPGRLDHALPSYRILVTDSPDEAYNLAQDLAQTNTERQRLTEEFFSKAKSQLSTQETGSPLLMVGGEDFPQGITGLIAGKLVGEFYRPSIVFEQGQSTSTGSARSVNEFDIIAAIKECQDLLIRFGGHPMAAGFTLPTENLAPFQERLLHIATNQLSDLELYPFLIIDAEVPLSTIDGETFKFVESLAPFGNSNPLPTFLSTGIRVIDCYPVGTQSRHLKLKMREGDISWPGIGFNLGHLAGEITSVIDLVYNIKVDRWNGENTLSLNILDFAPAS